MFAGDKKFRLQLLPAAGSETHAKVGQALVPGTGYAHLLCAVFCPQVPDRMQVAGSSPRAKKFGMAAERSGLAFDPHFVDVLVAPVGKQADAIPRPHDLVEMFFQRRHRQVLVYILPDLITGLYTQGHFCYRAKPAKMNHRQWELLAVFGQSNQLSRSRYELHSGYSAGKIAVVNTRAMGRGCTAARYGNMRQGSSIVQRISFVIEEYGQLAIMYTGFYCHRM